MAPLKGFVRPRMLLRRQGRPVPQCLGDGLGERELPFEDLVRRGAGDRDPAATSLPAQPLQVRDLAGSDHPREMLPDGRARSGGDPACGRRVPGSSASPGGGSAFVDELDRPLEVEERVDDTVARRWVARPDTEQHVPRSEAMTQMAREASDCLGGLERPFSNHRLPRENRVPGARAGIDPDDDRAPLGTRLKGMADRGAERATIDLLPDRQHVRVGDEPGLAGGRQNDRNPIRDSPSREKADGRPVSLPKEPRELVVERRVSGDESDRPVSHRSP